MTVSSIGSKVVTNYLNLSMLEFSKLEITYLLKALIEHCSKLDRMDYRGKKRDQIPYKRLIQKLTKYRAARFVQRG